jgi:hypothetical protein
MRYLVLMLALLAALAVWAEEAADPFALDNLLKTIPPLTHDASGHFPIVTWEPFILKAKDNSFWEAKALPDDAYRELAKRGLAQTVRLDAKYIPIALAVQRAGMKVILLEGGGGDGPGNEAPDTLHKLPADVKPKDGVHPCPLLLAGWHNRAMKVRETLRQFKDAGVNIEGAWLDWENQPWWGNSEWEQSKRCTRCRELFPPGILDDYLTYRGFILRFRQQLFSTYLAAPILEAYPKCQVTNWAVVTSTPDRPTAHYWGPTPFPPMDTGLFTATNPVAYGNDAIFPLQWHKLWKNGKDTPCDQAHMDRAYTAVMLAQMSDDAANTGRWAPEKPSYPWVCRYCPDMEDPKIPMLSRARYRELLRHIWLRGADSLQVFNAYRANTPQIRLEEVADAVASYDEALAYRPFLERGTVMNTAVPGAEENGPIWSGLKLQNEAIIRAFTQHEKAVTLILTPWEDAAFVKLIAPPEGATYHLVRVGGDVRVEVVR